MCARTLARALAHGCMGRACYASGARYVIYVTHFCMISSSSLQASISRLTSSGLSFTPGAERLRGLSGDFTIRFRVSLLAAQQAYAGSVTILAVAGPQPSDRSEPEPGPVPRTFTADGPGCWRYPMMNVQRVARNAQFARRNLLRPAAQPGA